MLTLTQTSATNTTYYLTSSKFTFSSNPPKIVPFFQWITATYSTFNYNNYWSWISASSYGSSQVRISFFDDSTYRKGMSIVVLLINTQASINRVTAQTGDSWSHLFTHNFGVNTSLYGQPQSGNHCLFGL